MNEVEARALLAERTCGGVPLKVGLLSNPGSGRNRRGLEQLDKLLVPYPEVVHRQAQTPAQVSEVMQEFANRSVDLVALNSGDGTVQAALTALFNDQAFDRLPLLALLRGGSTNVNIGDIGIQGNRDKGLSRLLSWADRVHTGVELRERPVLRVTASPHSSPIYGMLFGAGAITRGIEYYHRNVHNKGVYDGLATGLTTLRMLLAVARRDPEYVAPVSILVETDPTAAQRDRTTADADYLLLLVSALERLFLGIHPYWGEGPGALHYTAVHGQPAYPLRAIPSLFMGRPNRFGTLKNGYESLRVDELHLTMTGHFTLDGELYEANSTQGPVSVRRDGPVTFIRL
ncbi:MAG: hypothetical protein GY703_02525 [Gammaproteobacteria bacterium]|nr:hypothetical protein [Gammaproteobacteria bacterium]